MASNRKLPLDLLFVAGLVFLTDILVLVPVFSGSLLRTYIGVLMVLFLPGYALTGALFPAKNDLDGIERAMVSLGLSVAVVPTMGLILNYTSWGIREIPILTVISAFTLLMCVIAYYRRSLLPETEVFEVPFKTAVLNIKAEIFEKPESVIDKFLSVFLILLVLASVCSLIYIIVNPKEGEHFTEFYILGPNKTADNYQTEFKLGEKGTVFVGVINHEHRPMDYTLDVKLGNKSLPLSENQKRIRLEDNMSLEEPITFAPNVVGNYTKLEFLLFNDTEKTIPYRNLHLWVNVTKET